MEEIGARDGLFFIDSYTTHESVALSIARESGIPSLKRDIFLDSTDDEESIAREFERLKVIARERGHAVGIGHPYRATMLVLEREIPKLAEQGFELAKISALVGVAPRIGKPAAAH